MGILITQFAACFFGCTGIIFGAFGAHILKKKFTPELMASFETGVKYQMYHALALLILSFNLHLTKNLEHTVVLFFTLGTFLFSFSIYGLCLSAAAGKKMKWLGPLTPLGGLFLAGGWLLLLFLFMENYF